MSRFDIDVTRDGGWWMVHIPELGGRTRARLPREVSNATLIGRGGGAALRRGDEAPTTLKRSSRNPSGIHLGF
jgi:hypothetical protein